MTATNPFAIIVADVHALIAKLIVGLRWFAKEAAVAVAWVDANVPGAQQALATLFQVADASATTLEQHAASGLADVVSRAVDGAGATMLNLINGAGLDLTTKQALSAADVATVAAAQSIAVSSINVATAKLLGETAAVVGAANHANSVAAPAGNIPAAA
jgi:hypothetical protein